MRSMHTGLFIYRLHFWLQIAMPCVKRQPQHLPRKITPHFACAVVVSHGT